MPKTDEEWDKDLDILRAYIYTADKRCAELATELEPFEARSRAVAEIRRSLDLVAVAIDRSYAYD